MDRTSQTMAILRMRIPFLSLVILPILVATITLAPSAQAQARPGEYRCIKMEIGGQSSRCQSPALILNEDGSYKIWGEYGTYEFVQDRWLVLSHSKRRGLGYFQNPREIVFEYRIGK